MENYLLFIDTETIGSLFYTESVVPFEIGVKIYNQEKGKVEYQKSYIVRKFFNNKYIMYSSFSASKYPSYFEKLETDKRYKLMSAKDIQKELSRVIKKYNIKTMVAHNGKFDKVAVQRYFDDMGIENPMKNLHLLDTMEISKVITQRAEYEKYCIANKDITRKNNNEIESLFLTKSGRVRTTAQAIYSYISNNPNFQEAHTALEDIDIEIAIYENSKIIGGVAKLDYTPSWRDWTPIV